MSDILPEDSDQIGAGSAEPVNVDSAEVQAAATENGDQNVDENVAVVSLDQNVNDGPPIKGRITLNEDDDNLPTVSGSGTAGDQNQEAVTTVGRDESADQTKHNDTAAAAVEDNNVNDGTVSVAAAGTVSEFMNQFEATETSALTEAAIKGNQAQEQNDANDFPDVTASSNSDSQKSYYDPETAGMTVNQAQNFNKYYHNNDPHKGVIRKREVRQPQTMPLSNNNMTKMLHAVCYVASQCPFDSGEAAEKAELLKRPPTLRLSNNESDPGPGGSPSSNHSNQSQNPQTLVNQKLQQTRSKNLKHLQNSMITSAIPEGQEGQERSQESVDQQETSVAAAPADVITNQRDYENIVLGIGILVYCDSAPDKIWCACPGQIASSISIAKSLKCVCKLPGGYESWDTSGRFCFEFIFSPGKNGEGYLNDPVANLTLCLVETSSSDPQLKDYGITPKMFAFPLYPFIYRNQYGGMFCTNDVCSESYQLQQSQTASLPSASGKGSGGQGRNSNQSATAAFGSSSADNTNSNNDIVAGLMTMTEQKAKTLAEFLLMVDLKFADEPESAQDELFDAEGNFVNGQLWDKTFGVKEEKESNNQQSPSGNSQNNLSQSQQSQELSMSKNPLQQPTYSDFGLKRAADLSVLDGAELPSIWASRQLRATSRGQDGIPITLGGEAKKMIRGEDGDNIDIDVQVLDEQQRQMMQDINGTGSPQGSGDPGFVPVTVTTVQGTVQSADPDRLTNTNSSSSNNKQTDSRVQTANTQQSSNIATQPGGPGEESPGSQGSPSNLLKPNDGSPGHKKKRRASTSNRKGSIKPGSAQDGTSETGQDGTNQQSGPNKHIRLSNHGQLVPLRRSTLKFNPEQFLPHNAPGYILGAFQEEALRIPLLVLHSGVELVAQTTDGIKYAMRAKNDQPPLDKGQILFGFILDEAIGRYVPILKGIHQTNFDLKKIHKLDKLCEKLQEIKAIPLNQIGESMSGKAAKARRKSRRMSLHGADGADGQGQSDGGPNQQDNSDGSDDSDSNIDQDDLGLSLSESSDDDDPAALAMREAARKRKADKEKRKRERQMAKFNQDLANQEDGGGGGDEDGDGGGGGSSMVLGGSGGSGNQQQISTDSSNQSQQVAIAHGSLRATNSKNWTIEQQKKEKDRKIEMVRDRMSKYCSTGLKTDVMIRMIASREKSVAEFYSQQMLQACLSSDLHEFRKAICCCRDSAINKQWSDFNNRTLLHLIAQNCSPNNYKREEAIGIMQLLIKNFADYRLLDNDGLNALMSHAKVGSFESMQFLLNKIVVDEPTKDAVDAFLMKESNSGHNCYELCLLYSGEDDCLRYLAKHFPKILRPEKIRGMLAAKKKFALK